MDRGARHLIALIAALTACTAPAAAGALSPAQVTHVEPPAATVRVGKLQAQKPELKLKLVAGDAPIVKATMTLPDGLEFTKGGVFNRGASVRIGEKEITGEDLRHSSSRVNFGAAAAQRATATFKRGAVLRTGSLEKPGLSFPVQVVDTEGTRTPLVVPAE